MKLTTAIHTLGVFITVALATFIAGDPKAIPDIWKAVIVAVIAGLAAIGITPPWAKPDPSVIVAPADSNIHEMLRQAVEDEKKV